MIPLETPRYADVQVSSLETPEKWSMWGIAGGIRGNPGNSNRDRKGHLNPAAGKV